MNFSEIITAFVAVYGALLATFTLVVQVREKRQRVTVTLSQGFIAEGGGGAVDVLILEAANGGAVPIYLSTCQLRLPATKEKLFSRLAYNKDFPATLNPGESVQAWLSSETFVAAIRKSKSIEEITVVAEFSNKGGGVYRSKALLVNLEKMFFAKQHADNGAA